MTEKRIALFVGDLKSEYHYLIVTELENQLNFNSDFRIYLDVFQNFSIYGSNIMFAYGEKNIVNIPVLDKYDAIVICADTFSLSGHEESLMAAFKSIPSTPIFSLRKEVDGCYNILIDDYSSMYQMVEHFIVKHSMKNIAFMKGRHDLKDAGVRFQAYLDAMNEYGLSVSDRMTFDGNYWTTLAKPACDWFLGGDTIPEAIVCANDYMAISLVQELQNRGYKIPEDIAVSGYDDTIESKTLSPSLTTVRISIKNIISTLLHSMGKLWNGVEIPKTIYTMSECVFRESCGCDTHSDSASLSKSLYDDKTDLIDVVNQGAFLHLNLNNAKTINDVITTLPIHFHVMDFSSMMYLCLVDESDKTVSDSDFTKNMVLRAVFSKYYSEYKNELFSREDIIPKHYNRSNMVSIVSLHSKDTNIGYIAIDGHISFSVAYFLQYLSLELVNWLVQYRLQQKVEQLQGIVATANIDALTGLPNRAIWNDEANKCYINCLKSNVSFFICSIDMDDLKPINDTYGHTVGDEALCCFARIIEANAKGIGVAARVGGDEFMICYSTSEESVVRESIVGIRNDIIEFNKRDGKFKLSASIGYAECHSGVLLSDCIATADNKMYDEKRRKKKERR